MSHVRRLTSPPTCRACMTRMCGDVAPFVASFTLLYASFACNFFSIFYFFLLKKINAYLDSLQCSYHFTASISPFYSINSNRSQPSIPFYNKKLYFSVFIQLNDFLIYLLKQKTQLLKLCVSLVQY